MLRKQITRSGGLYPLEQLQTVFLLHEIDHVVLQILWADVVFHDLPHIVLEVQPFQFLPHGVNESLTARYPHYLHVAFSTNNEVHPIQVKHEHLSLDLVVILVRFVHDYIVSLPLQIESGRFNCLVDRHVALAVRAFDFDGPDQFSLFREHETVRRSTQPRLIRANREC